MSESDDDTPLPPPLAHHVADPSRLADDFEPPTDADRLPPVPFPEDTDVAGELPTRQLAKLDAGDLAKLDLSPPTAPVERISAVDSIGMAIPRVPDGETDTEDELTMPRDLPRGMLPRAQTAVEDAALFAVLPAATRADVVARFVRRHVTASSVIIRQGETGHALFLVASGRLQLRVEQGGSPITLGYVRPGEFIGEGSLLARAPSRVQVMATEPCDLLVLAPRDAYDVAGGYPAVWAELKHAAERRTREWDAILSRR